MGNTRNTPIFLFIIVIIIREIYCNTITFASNIDARNVVLYSLSTTTMPDQTFPVNFQITFSTVPTFAFGMNQYKMGDAFYI